jgi:type II secretory pathway pseudopilin PulG
MELLVAIVIIAILAVLLVPVISKLRARAQRIQCAANLRNLYVAADLYLQQNGSWPQIARNTSDTGSAEYARAWIDALSPFGVGAKAWICPTIQNLLRNPDYLEPANVRLDYMPMPFDDKPTTPHEWPRQPWFAERGDVHGSGNLIIFTDGSIGDLKTVLGGVRGSQP